MLDPYSKMERLMANSQNASPIFQTVGLATILNHDRASSVSGLFVKSCPLTIIGVIITGVVFALQRVFSRWPRTHIGIEVCKLAPSVANPYATAAITRIAFSFFVVTSG